MPEEAQDAFNSGATDDQLLRILGPVKERRAQRLARELLAKAEERASANGAGPSSGLLK